MVKHDVSMEVGSQPGRIVLLLLFLQNVIDTVDGDTGLAHFGQHPPKTADRPDQSGVIGNKGHKSTYRNIAVYRLDGA